MILCKARVEIGNSGQEFFVSSLVLVLCSASLWSRLDNFVGVCNFLPNLRISLLFSVLYGASRYYNRLETNNLILTMFGPLGARHSRGRPKYLN